MTKFNSTRYCVKPPFKKHHKILPDNFQNSKTRLGQLLNKLSPNLLANDDEISKTYEKENIIEKMETVGKPALVHYLPYRAVIKNAHEKTMTRILCDAS